MSWRNLLCIRLECILVDGLLWFIEGQARRTQADPRRCFRAKVAYLTSQDFFLSSYTFSSGQSFKIWSLLFQVDLWSLTAHVSGNVLLHTSVKLLCLGVESPGFHGSAGEFTGLHRPSRSQLWFLMVKDTQPSPRKQKTPGESPGQTRDELWQSSSRGATQDGLHSRNICGSNTCEALSTREVCWTQCMGVMRAGHMGTLCLGPTKPPDSLKDSVFQCKPSHYRNSLGPVNHS